MSTTNQFKIIHYKNKISVDPLVTMIYKNFSYLKAFPHLQHNEQEIKRLLTDKGSDCYLIYDKDNKVVGYLIGEFKKLNDGRSVYYLSYLYISEKVRGKGLGKRTMNMIIDKCKDNHINHLVLTVDSMDRKVLQFYKNMNFVYDMNLNAAASDNRHIVLTLFIPTKINR